MQYWDISGHGQQDNYTFDYSFQLLIRSSHGGIQVFSGRVLRHVISSGIISVKDGSNDRYN